jgi:hypothetical protein
MGSDLKQISFLERVFTLLKLEAHENPPGICMYESL